MKTGLTISAIGHTALLLWGVVTFAAKPYTTMSTEAMPIDLITAAEFSQMTAGSRSAQPVEAAKPLVDKIGETKPVDDPNGKIAPKEITAAIDKPPPPPMPEPKPPVPVEKKPPEPKPPEPKRDLIAEAIKKDQAKKTEQKKVEAKPPPKKTQPQQPAFEPKRIEALLDKRTPQRLAATGEVPNPTAPLGTSGGFAAQLSQSELDALRARLAQLWSPPPGATNPDDLVVRIRMKLTPDGRLAAPPMLTTSSSGRGPLYEVAAGSAIRAVLRGQPYDMLRPEHYEQWKDVEITFDPRDMIRG